MPELAPDERPEPTAAYNVFALIENALNQNHNALVRIEDKLDRKADVADLVRLELRVDKAEECIDKIEHERGIEADRKAQSDKAAEERRAGARRKSDRRFTICLTLIGSGFTVWVLQVALHIL